MFDHVRAAAADQHALVESLAGLHPAELGPVLGRLDRTRLSGAELAIVVGAEHRLTCWVQAGMAASMAEFARCPTDTYADVPRVRTDEDNDDADDELALVLHATSVSAGRTLEEAVFAYRTARVVWACWRDGFIDAAKVHALQEVTLGADPAVAATVTAILLSAVVIDKAGRSNLDRAITDTPPALRRRALRLLLKLDPDASARRRQQRVTRRRMVAGQDRDGLGYLSGLDLPLEQVVAADGFVDHLARQLKHRGDERTLTCLRADIFLALLSGRSAGQILADHAGDTGADEAGDPPTARDAERAGVPYANWQAEYPSTAELARYGHADPAEQTEIDAAVARLVADWPEQFDTVGGQLAAPVGWSDPARLAARHWETSPAEADCADRPDVAGATLIWLTDWRATQSRRAVRRTRTGPWHAQPAAGHAAAPARRAGDTTEPTGTTSRVSAEPTAGTTGGNPPGRPADQTPAGSGTADVSRWPAPLLGRPLVELLVPYDLLCGGSTPAEANGWGLIPAEVARRLLTAAAAAPSDWCLTVVDDTGRVVTHARTKHDPTVAQKRFVQARDRMCTYPGCRRKADRCDLDHRIPWEHGGATCPCNLHPLCRHHHQVKQADGWHVTRHPVTGITRWSTPHGITATNDTDHLDPDLYRTETGHPPGHADPPGDPPAQRAAPAA